MNNFLRGVVVGSLLVPLFSVIMSLLPEQSPPMPKVGECYESYYKGKGKEDPYYEYRKIVKVNPEDKYNAVVYVYNFPNSVSSEKGTWYETIIGPPKESKYWFFGANIEDSVVNKIECPW